MKLAYRLADEANDYWRIRQFLREVLTLNDRRELSWPVHRFDHWRWRMQ